jgi:hypothetical protein
MLHLTSYVGQNKITMFDKYHSFLNLSLLPGAGDCYLLQVTVITRFTTFLPKLKLDKLITTIQRLSASCSITGREKLRTNFGFNLQSTFRIDIFVIKMTKVHSGRLSILTKMSRVF